MKNFTTIILFITLTLTAKAQWETEMMLHTSIDDNVNNNYEQLHDRITQLGIGTDYTMNSADCNTNIFYQGSYNYYVLLTDKVFYQHSAGVNAIYYGENDEFEIGAVYSGRLNRSTYSFLGYNEFNTFVIYKAEPFKGYTYNAGNRVTYTTFNELTDLNNIEDILFLNITHSFETNTTIILGGDIGAKWYLVSTDDEITTHAKGNGGVMKSIGTFTSQASASLKIGQSVFNKTGISGYIRYQASVANNTRSLLNIYSVTDDEIFDTRYGYEGLYYEFSLKQLLPYALAAEIGYGVAEKNYINASAYDLSGNIISPSRNDMRYVFSIEIKKGIDISENNSLTLSLLYDSIVNNSNDSYFNYKNSVFAVRLGFGF